MNTFSKLYDTELHNQEIKSNKRTLMGFCWFFLTLLVFPDTAACLGFNHDQFLSDQ